MARPSDYSQEKADAICARLADGESLRAICRDDGMPSESTVRAWALDDREGFYAQYTRARDIGYETLEDEMREIADTPRIGVKTTTKESGVETVEADMIEHRRLQIDTRKWVLSKMLPKKYGDKVTQEHTGSLRVVSATDLKDDELAAIASSGSV